MLSLLAAAAIAPAAFEFRTMSFNIWVGGTQFQPLSQTVKVIRDSGADIVGIQEPGENLGRIAEGLGWHRSDKASIVSRFEIVEEWRVVGNRWGGAKIKLPNGASILFYNDHFNPYPYGPYEVRDKKATTERGARSVEEGAGRVGQMLRVLADLAARPDRDLPVVFTGDFNTPSHLDWVAGTRDRNFGLAVRWPVTALSEAAGFKDAFRLIHPDPAAKPGFTWSPGYPVGNVAVDDVMDRIDFVIFRGELEAVDAKVVGETGPHTDIAVDPWPSDHRAVLVHFRIAG